MKKLTLVLLSNLWSVSLFAEATVFQCKDLDTEEIVFVTVDESELQFESRYKTVSVQAKLIEKISGESEKVFSVSYDEYLSRYFYIDQNMIAGKPGKMTSVFDIGFSGEEFEVAYSCETKH